MKLILMALFICLMKAACAVPVGKTTSTPLLAERGIFDGIFRSVVQVNVDSPHDIDYSKNQEPKKGSGSHPSYDPFLNPVTSDQ